MCVSVLWEERMQAGNWVAEELAKEQERKIVKTETRQWNYYFSATRETQNSRCHLNFWDGKIYIYMAAIDTKNNL